MIPRARSPFLFPFLSVATATSLAQAPPIPIETVVPVHTAPDDPEGHRYGVVGSGPGYRVSFHDGFAMEPMVGPDRRERVELRWRTVSCRIGALELRDLARDPALRWHDTRCELDHGAFVEAYELRQDGVEQTFVLACRPAARGDLCIVGEFDGLEPGEHGATGDAEALPERGVGTAGELALCDAAGLPLVFYGTAVAIDANGERRAMRRTHDGRRVALTVDAAWLERAAYPLVIDPLLRPNLGLGFTRRVVDVDVFRDDLENDHEIWLATVVEDAVGGDRDLFVHRVRADFTDPREVFRDVTSNWSTMHARLAGVGGTDRVVALFQRRLSNGDAVRWHLHDKGSLAFSSLVAGVARPTGTQDSRPDVGGTDAFSAGRFALFAWQRDVAATPTNTQQSRVFVAALDTASGTQGVLGAPALLDADGQSDDESPSINQEAEGGGAFSWAVAWQRDDDNPFLPRSVAIRLVDRSGTPSVRRLDVPAGFPLSPQGPPQIAGRNGRYLCAYGMTGNGGTFHELVATRVDWPHGQPVGTTPHGGSPIEADFNRDMRLHGLAFDTTTRSHWVVTHREEGFEQLRATKVGFRGRVVEREDLSIQGDLLPLASAVAFDDDEGRFLIAAAMQPRLPTLPGAVAFDAMLYEDRGPLAPYGAACGPGRLAWFGSQHVGDESTSFAMLQGTPNTAVFVALALAPATVDLAFVGMPGCTLLANPSGPGGLGAVGLISDAGGRIDLAMPLPEGLSPATLHFQVFQLAPGSNAAGVVATRGLAVPLGR